MQAPIAPHPTMESAQSAAYEMSVTIPLPNPSESGEKASHTTDRSSPRPLSAVGSLSFTFDAAGTYGPFGTGAREAHAVRHAFRPADVLRKIERRRRSHTLCARDLLRGFCLPPDPDVTYLGFVPSKSDSRPFLNALPLDGPQPDGSLFHLSLPVSSGHKFALFAFALIVVLGASAAVFYLQRSGVISAIA